MRYAIWLVVAGILAIGWAIPATDPATQCWEVDVISAGERPVETWHVTGPIHRDDEGFLFVCREHGRFRIDACMVVAVRKSACKESPGGGN